MLVTSKSFPDKRGFFLENFKNSEFTTNGIKTKFVQDNFSHSVKGVLRGLFGVLGIFGFSLREMWFLGGPEGG